MPIKFSRLFICSLAFLLTQNLGAVAEQSTQKQTLPPALENFMGSIWLLIDINPVHYVQYGEDMEDGAILFAGMDNDGNIIGGDLSHDPNTGQTTMFSVRNGKVTELSVTFSGDTIIMVGKEAGASIRQTFKPVHRRKYKVEFDEWRSGRWVRLREYDYHRASADSVRGLNWIERNPEAELEAEEARKALMAERPSFWRSFTFAIQDGLVAGTRSGVEVFVHNAVVNENDDLDAIAESDD